MTFIHQPSDFDILFKNLFDSESNFNTLKGYKSPHPVDIYEEGDRLFFAIACTGISKKDVTIQTEQHVLRVSYNKEQEEEPSNRTYQTRGIARRSFDLAYKVAAKYDLTKAEAVMQDGLLTISMPFTEEAKPKQLKIN